MRKLLAIPLLFLFGCDLTTGSTVVADTTISSTDTIRKLVILDTITHTINANIFKPIYQFSVNNLNYKLQINKDSSYQLQEEGNQRFHSYNGNWLIHHSRLLLAQDSDTISVFDIRNDSLLLTVLKGENVGLIRPHAHENAEWAMSDKLTKNRLVYAIGTEPFWSLEINTDSIRFQMADWKQPLVHKTPKPVSNADSVRFVINPKLKYSITLLNRFCSDGMSDRLYPATIKIYHNNQTYSGCAITSTDVRNSFR